jgi:hypothetical protein
VESDNVSRDLELVIVASFGNEAEALLARSRLDAEGIPSMIQRDDAGGMYPQFQGVRGLKLRVPAEFADSARELLGTTDEGGAGADTAGFDGDAGADPGLVADESPGDSSREV